MNNKQIKKDIQKIYNPETVFGNSEVINLIERVKVPNDDENFETQCKKCKAKHLVEVEK